MGVRSVAAARADGQSANQPPADIPSPEIARQEDVDRGYSGALDTFEIYGDLL
jgi:hypothetical protein